jgi:hypothetical protein
MISKAENTEARITLMDLCVPHLVLGQLICYDIYGVPKSFDIREESSLLPQFLTFIVILGEQGLG